MIPTVPFIQFAVIAIDPNLSKIQQAQRRAIINGVAHKVDFIVGDFIVLGRSLKADAVFLRSSMCNANLEDQVIYFASRSFEIQIFIAFNEFQVHLTIFFISGGVRSQQFPRPRAIPAGEVRLGKYCILLALQSRRAASV
jgi:RNA cap guanine-N2 methyltransferase